MADQFQSSLFEDDLPDIPKKPTTDDDIQNCFERLLEPDKVFRDSVHGDIWLNETEVAIVNTPVFQRLRRIKQLAPTELVYHTAMHTRFAHSIGTVHVAQQIVDAVNKNHKLELSTICIRPEDQFVARIIALIHDLAHVPYGHTIEDEGNLFDKKKQWLNEKRRDAILNEIVPVILKQLSEAGMPSSTINTVKENVQEILIAEEIGEDAIHKLNVPFLADIVGNTICADLIDYLQRDLKETGLQSAFDSRIISHFILADYSLEGITKTRLALMVERRRGKKRRDILSECVTLLRMRYSLAERVYYHRVKSIFSSMVIKMMYCAHKANIIDLNDLLKFGDDTLIYHIFSSPDPSNEYAVAAKKLSEAFINREVFIELHAVPSGKRDAFESLKQYLDKDKRYKMERELEFLFKLDPGSIIIYSPKLDSGKQAQVKIVQYDIYGKQYVTTLSQMGEQIDHNPTLGSELKNLKFLHESLWTFYVLINPRCINPPCINGHNLDVLKNACKERFDKGEIGQLCVQARGEITGIPLTGPQARKIATEVIEEEWMVEYDIGQKLDIAIGRCLRDEGNA